LRTIYQFHCLYFCLRLSKGAFSDRSQTSSSTRLSDLSSETALPSATEAPQSLTAWITPSVLSEKRIAGFQSVTASLLGYPKALCWEPFSCLGARSSSCMASCITSVQMISSCNFIPFGLSKPNHFFNYLSTNALRTRVSRLMTSPPPPPASLRLSLSIIW